MKPIHYESEETRRLREEMAARDRRRRLDEAKCQYRALEQTHQEKIHQLRQKAVEALARVQGDASIPEALRVAVQAVGTVALDDRLPRSKRKQLVHKLGTIIQK